MIVALALLLGACGSTRPAAHTPATSPSPTARYRTAPGAAAGAGSAQPASTTPSTGGAAANPSGGATNARVPATFVIRAGERLSPSSVSSPAFLAVQLTVVSADGRPHRGLLRTPKAYSLSVASGGRASVLVPGLRAGRYGLEIDGARRGTLIIGAAPGP